ncbi:hypothetical protein LguiA_008424 [Lonicera macranthoides]
MHVIYHKKVLLVLNDVEQMDQIYAILGMQDWLFPGSKVIITTRHKRLLKPHQIYKVKQLYQDESVKPFSLHAFGGDCQIKSYKKHIERVVQICEGLPLALKVIGSSLSGKSKDEWGTNTVEGLSLDMRMLKEAGNNAKKRRYEDFCDKSIFSKYVTSLKRRSLSIISERLVNTSLRSPNDVYLTTDAFKSMTKLRLLKLNYVKLTGSYKNFRKSLAWLSWHGFSLKCIPVEFPMENLVVLDLRYSMLKQVWKETPILDLSYSELLARTPNFLGLPNLERLILKGCVSLVEICESIGELEMLNLLDLKDCKTLMKLPRNIGKLGSLKTLVISGCNIGELPSEMRNMKSLEVLNADGIAINRLHISSGEVKWWPLIICSIRSTPRKGPETLWASLPFSLKKLSLCGYNPFDDSFPRGFSNLQSFGWLELGKNPFQRLPNFFKDLSSLWIDGDKDLDGEWPAEEMRNNDVLDDHVAPRARIREVNRRTFYIAVKIENKTKDRTWIYLPAIVFNPYIDDMEWLSKWRFANQMEVGDEILVTFDIEDEYEVKECGFNIVYRDQVDENGTTTIEKSHHDFPAFQLNSGAHFLCQKFEKWLDEDYLPPKDNNLRR